MLYRRFLKCVLVNFGSNVEQVHDAIKELSIRQEMGLSKNDKFKKQ